jgi:hypothetical protein
LRLIGISFGSTRIRPWSSGSTVPALAAGAKSGSLSVAVAPIGAAAGAAVGAVSAGSPSPRACAASRRAQSWKVGQTGKALDRQ